MKFKVTGWLGEQPLQLEVEIDVEKVLEEVDLHETQTGLKEVLTNTSLMIPEEWNV